MMEDRMDLDEPSVKRKGRGFRQTGGEREDLIDNKNAVYDRLDDKEGGPSETAGRAARSIEGWLIFITHVHEEATEDDIQDKFGEFGEIKNLHLNLDRRTGYVKGYALVEYETRREAEAAIAAANNSPLLEQNIKCDFAFVRGPPGTGGGGNRPRQAAPNTASGSGAPPIGGKGGRGRSASPPRRAGGGGLIDRID